jgi:hypothetical protein
MSLLALSRHPLVHRQCLLLAVKRAWLTHGRMFAYDPKLIRSISARYVIRSSSYLSSGVRIPIPLSDKNAPNAEQRRRYLARSQSAPATNY